jgi:hypothetical protein
MKKTFAMVALLALVAAPRGAFPQNQGLLNARGMIRPSAGPIAHSQAIHEPFVAPITAAKIRTAIDDAVVFLRNCQAPDGSIGEEGHQGGVTGLAALAMLAAGADPGADDQLRKALDWLAKQEPDNTYVRGIRANVWEYALRKAPYDTRLRNLLKVDYEWLLAALGDREGWRYTMQSRDWDNSCTQYGVLGIWAAARAGFEPGDKFWLTMSKHFRTCQTSDGGWGYVGGSSPTPNMGTAGLASMFLVFDMYHARKAYRADSPNTFTEGEAADVLTSLDRGMTWLGKAQGNKNDGYYLYGIERTGVAGGRKYIGGEDWFARGAEAVLKSQQFNGAIQLGSWGGPVAGTSFCTLFLVYGGAPLAMEKLRYGEGQDWNLNPRDVANLSKFLWSAYERPMNWQVASLDAKDEFEAPILFISGAKAAHFTERQMIKLRDYLLAGGTILAEPSDHSPEFAQSMEELLRLMFPRRYFPDYELRPLPPEHGIFTVVKQDWQRLPKLRGASDGSRTFFILSDDYLAADWQTNRARSDAFKLATNLLFYATDLGELQGKFSSVLPSTPAAKSRRKSIKIARARFDGDSRQPADWDAASACWRKFSPYVRHVTGCTLEEALPVRPGDDKLEGIALLHLSGRGKIALAEKQRAVLKEFVEHGGTLLVDAYAGSPAFAASAQAELEAIIGPLKPLAAEHPLAEGNFEGGSDLSVAGLKLPLRQLLRRRGESSRGQKLLVYQIKNRPAVVFSPYDLTAAMAGIENYHSLGYKPDAARKIVGNLLAYLVAE